VVGFFVAFDVEQTVPVPKFDVSRVASRHFGALTVSHKQNSSHVVGGGFAGQTWRSANSRQAINALEGGSHT